MELWRTETDTGVITRTAQVLLTPEQPSYTWENLLLSRTNGARYTYELKEVDVPDDYLSDIQGNTQEGYVITNTYQQRTPLTLALQGTKRLEGSIEGLAANQFRFLLTDSLGRTLAQVTNDGDGKFIFPVQTLDTVGKHVFFVKEIKGNDLTVSYDGTLYTIVMDIEKDQAGDLQATTTLLKDGEPYTGETLDYLSFLNIVRTPQPSPEPTPPAPSGEPTGTPAVSTSPVPTGVPTETPVATASPVPTGEPTGTPAVSTSPVPTGEPTGTPAVSTSPVPTGEPTETPVATASPAPTGETTETPVATASPVPTGEPTETPVATASPVPTSPPTQRPVPTRTPSPSYTAITVKLEAEKQLRGRPLKAGEFSFVLYDHAGNELERVGNKADGTIDFAPRRFSKPGVFLYHIQEVKGTAANLHYDATRFTAQVDVSVQDGSLRYQVSYLKDGVPYGGKLAFVNRYDPPKTGDNQAWLITTLVLVSLATGSAWLLTSRRKKQR